MKIFLKRIFSYVLFWSVIILILGWLGYLRKMVDNYMDEVPAFILVMAVIGYLTSGVVIFILLKKLYWKIKRDFGTSSKARFVISK